MFLAFDIFGFLVFFKKKVVRKHAKYNFTKRTLVEKEYTIVLIAYLADMQIVSRFYGCPAFTKSLGPPPDKLY